MRWNLSGSRFFGERRERSCAGNDKGNVSFHHNGELQEQLTPTSPDQLPNSVPDFSQKLPGY
jgi:hypothetical protein